MIDSLTFIAICLAVSFIVSEIFFRFHYPRVLGQITAGVILAIPLFSVIFPANAFNDISFLADLGIIFLLLLTGMQLNINKFKRSQRESMIIALFCVLIPFVLGYGLMKAVGYSDLVAVVVGSCFSLTAEATKLKVLLDMKALNTRVGVIMLGAGILDDLFEVIFLSAVLFLANKQYVQIAIIPLKVVLFVVMIYITYKLFPLILRIIQKERSRIATFSYILIFGIIVAVISNNLDLGPIIGAFVAGIIINLTDRRKYEHKENIKELEAMTFALIIPFFFINIGLHFDFSSFGENIWLILAVLITATIGKLLGSLAATPWTDLTFKQTHLIGWGMNSRGAIELVIAEVARSAGLIPIEVYSAIVFMAIITTMAFPVIMKKIVSKNRDILN